MIIVSSLTCLVDKLTKKEPCLFFFFGGILAENLMILSESGILLKQKLEKKGDNCE
jgi:hypothetical protein